MTLLRLVDALPSDQVEIIPVLFAEGPLARRLRQRGLDVHVMPMREDVRTASRFEVMASPGHAVRSAATSLLFARRLAAALRALDVDVVHTTSLKADLVGALAARQIRKPLVWHVHDRIAPDYLPARVGHIVRLVARIAPARVVVNSAVTARTLPKARGLTVVHPTLDPVTMSPLPERSLAPPGVPVVGMVARLSSTKGQDVFLRAAAQVAERRPDVRFRLVGSALFGQAEYAASLSDLVEELGLADRVDFRGFVEDPTQELDQFSVFVHASPIPEPFGLATLEAMARGVPVVVAADGGPADLVRPVGEPDLGTLVVPGDPTALASGILATLDAGDQTRARALRARERVLARYRPQDSAAALLSSWRQARGQTSRPAVVIAHDYLTQRGGGERVVLAMARAFPEAPIVTSLYQPEETYPEFRDMDVRVSPLNRVGLLRRSHRLALPLLAPTVKRMTIDADVVLASSSGWAHGFSTTGDMVVYCHSPARWLYLTDEYVGSGPTAWVQRAAVAIMRRPLLGWDDRAAHRAQRYLANSTVVVERIRQVYGLDATLVPPPYGVNVDGAQEAVAGVADWAGDGFHLTVSRLLPYKNVGAVIDAFRRLPAERLVVVGSGPMEAELRASLPDNVVLVSGISDSQLRWLYANARAVVAASFEDFGLTPVEGMAFGKPCVALRGGGYLDTVAEGRTGLFFDAPEPELIAAAVTAAAARGWDRDDIAHYATRYGEPHFAQQLRDIVEDIRAARRPEDLRT
ncbi:MAG: glycosyltransferase family 4 protein [Nostocoides sp.]